MFIKVTSCEQVAKITYRSLAEVMEVMWKYPFAIFASSMLFSYSLRTLCHRARHSQLLESHSTLLKATFC